METHFPPISTEKNAGAIRARPESVAAFRSIPTTARKRRSGSVEAIRIRLGEWVP